MARGMRVTEPIKRRRRISPLGVFDGISREIERAYRMADREEISRQEACQRVNVLIMAAKVLEIRRGDRIEQKLDEVAARLDADKPLLSSVSVAGRG